MTKRMACQQHEMGQAVVDGWYVCLHCRLVAACPGCVEVVDPDVLFYLCEQHQQLRMVEGYGSRMVWTKTPSEQLKGR